MMTPQRTTPGGTLRTRHTLAALAATLLLGATGCGYTADDCAAAIDDTSTKTNRPTECQDISDDDYETLLLGYILRNKNLLPTTE